MIVLTNSVTISRPPYDPPKILAFIFKRSHNQTSDLHSNSDTPPVMMKRGWFDYGFFQPHKIRSRCINVLTFILQPPNFKTLPDVLYSSYCSINLTAAFPPCSHNPSLFRFTPFHSLLRYSLYTHSLISTYSHRAHLHSFSRSTSIEPSSRRQVFKEQKEGWVSCWEQNQRDLNSWKDIRKSGIYWRKKSGCGLSKSSEATIKKWQKHFQGRSMAWR